MTNDQISFYLFWAVAAVLLLSLNSCGGITPVPRTTDYWETENNDYSSQADQMSLAYSAAADGFDYTGAIRSEDTSADWYSLRTTQTGQLSVTLASADLATDEHISITLFDSALDVLDTRSLGALTGVSTTVSSNFGEPAGVFYVRINADSWTHNYDLNPDFTYDHVANAYWEQESNNNSSLADYMPLDYLPESDGYDYTGAITQDSPSDDWYQFRTTQSGQLTVTLNCMDLAFGERIYITLFSSALTEIDARSVAGSPGGSVTVWSAAFAAPSTYYVRVDADSGMLRYDLYPEFTR